MSYLPEYRCEIFVNYPIFAIFRQLWHNLQMAHIAGIGKQYRKKLSLVLKTNSYLITSLEVSKTLGVSAQESGRLLSRWYKSGWISRIKRGVYIPLSVSANSNEAVIEEPSLIANSLFGKGYVGGFSAVKHWDLSEQIMEVTTYFTLKKVKDRNPIIGGSKFNLKTISDYKLFGLSTIWVSNQKIMISDPTKTIIDMLDDPRLAGGVRILNDVLEEYLDSKYFDINKLIEYGLKMKNRTIFKRLGFLMQVKFEADKDTVLRLHELISPSYSDLDPTLECEHFLQDWRLKVSSSWLKEYDRKRRNIRNV